jgi:hypothetical protein
LWRANGADCLYGVAALFGIAVLAMIWFCWRSAGRSDIQGGVAAREQEDLEAGEKEKEG